jgi:hypothetical protein
MTTSAAATVTAVTVAAADSDTSASRTIGISRPTVYRSLEQTTALPPLPPTPAHCPQSPRTTSS